VVVNSAGAASSDAFRAVAIARRLVAPAACMASIVGAISTALATARAVTAALPLACARTPD
jgi:hypothetical protein